MAETARAMHHALVTDTREHARPMTETGDTPAPDLTDDVIDHLMRCRRSLRYETLLDRWEA